MDWFRWHHGTVTDPKFRLLASRAGVRVADVIAVWSAILENASQSETRGTLDGWDDEVIAVALDMEPEQVVAIVEQMRARGMIDGEENVAAWEKRQPKREDSSAERVRRYRSKQNEAKRNVTQRNAPEEIRGEERREKNTTASREASEYPPEFEKTWSIYPKREGGNPKAKALKAWRARCREGYTPDELHAGVVRYGRHLKAKGKLGTEFVQQAATFFGPDKHFSQPWAVAEDHIDQSEMWAGAL